VVARLHIKSCYRKQYASGRCRGPRAPPPMHGACSRGKHHGLMYGCRTCEPTLMDMPHWQAPCRCGVLAMQGPVPPLPPTPTPNEFARARSVDRNFWNHLYSTNPFTTRSLGTPHIYTKSTLSKPQKRQPITASFPVPDRATVSVCCCRAGQGFPQAASGYAHRLHTPWLSPTCPQKKTPMRRMRHKQCPTLHQAQQWLLTQPHAAAKILCMVWRLPHCRPLNHLCRHTCSADAPAAHRRRLAPLH
jgi:hypothetical protein